MKRWDRTDFPTLMHSPNIHSVLRKITIDLLYFWDDYEVNLWKILLAEVRLIHAEQRSLYNFVILRKKTMDTDQD